MTTKLSFLESDQNLRFRCIAEAGDLPPEAWSAHACVVEGTSTPANVGPLLSLLEDGLAQCDGKEIVVPAAHVAELSQGELLGLGLPPPCSYTLQVRPDGLIADPSFRLTTRWLHPDHRPVQGAQSQGLFLQVGSRRYTVRQPIFGWLAAINSFNDGAGTDPRERLPALAEVMGELAEQVVLDGHLRDLRVVAANAFTISPRLSPSGELDFEVVALAGRISTRGRSESDPLEPTGRSPLPPAKQEGLAAQFRKFSEARNAYALGGDWYVAFPPDVTKVLREVKRFQSAPASLRREFIRNPRALLKQALPGDESEALVETTFDDSGEYSERVREIGLWTPKVLPFIRPASQPWLPPDEGGLRVGDEIRRIPRGELAEVIAKVETAIADGKPFASISSGPIPATMETLAALQQLREEYARHEAKPQTGEEKPDGPSSRIALLVHDNLDELAFKPDPRSLRQGHDQLPDQLTTKLLEHQIAGVDWLRKCWAEGRRGALLADDMGLGKTLQALVFLAWVQQQQPESRPMLIVAPTGLLRTWQREIETHLAEPRLGTLLEAHGASLTSLRRLGSSATTEQRHGVASLDEERLKRTDVVLTTYETLRDYQISFGPIAWSVLVFDEAQKIKNPAALMTDAAKGMNADFTIAMTGTPVENSLQDLWSILDTVEPGMLGALKPFLGRYEPDGEAGDAALAELKSRLLEGSPPQIILRRMKVDHLHGLPDIHHHVIPATMPPEQAEAYTRAVRAAQGVAHNMNGMLSALQTLRMVSLHPHLDRVQQESEFFACSARLQHLCEVLDKVAGANEKALVFLESRAVQGLLTQHLQRRYGLGSPPMIINGDVPGGERQRRVEAFQAHGGFDVMLLSPRAGGVGITLTAANHVIHLARWWNPAVEDQCTDRVYRIGQRRPVYVHVPLALHPKYGAASFDQRLHDLLERKRQLSRSLLAPAAEGKRDIEELFNSTTEVI